jgi:hypothetical protein
MVAVGVRVIVICWRCEEPIEELYMTTGEHRVERVRLADSRFLGSHALCADCTDEMAELSAP